MAGNTGDPELPSGGKKNAREKRVQRIEVTIDHFLADQPKGEVLPRPVLQAVERAKKGNVRALIALKCWDCSCYQREEIRECAVIACPLYPVRPYQ